MKQVMLVVTTLSVVAAIQGCTPAVDPATEARIKAAGWVRGYYTWAVTCKRDAVRNRRSCRVSYSGYLVAVVQEVGSAPYLYLPNETDWRRPTLLRFDDDKKPLRMPVITRHSKQSVVRRRLAVERQVIKRMKDAKILRVRAHRWPAGEFEATLAVGSGFAKAMDYMAECLKKATESCDGRTGTKLAKWAAACRKRKKSCRISRKHLFNTWKQK